MKKIITCDDWEINVPFWVKNEKLWQFYGYRKALYLYHLTWHDCDDIIKDYRGRSLSDQLIRCTGSISANIEEGHGRGFHGKERLLFLRYAIASARETKGWYFRCQYLLTPEILDHRLATISEVIALIAKEINRHK